MMIIMTPNIKQLIKELNCKITCFFCVFFLTSMHIFTQVYLTTKKIM